jgi:hypothetical protein
MRRSRRLYGWWPLKGDCAVALHAGSSPSPAPWAVAVATSLSPRFSVELAKPTIHPEPQRDGAHACNVFRNKWKKHKPGAIPLNVKLPQPPRQSREFCQSNKSVFWKEHGFKVRGKSHSGGGPGLYGGSRIAVAQAVCQAPFPLIYNVSPLSSTPSTHSPFAGYFSQCATLSVRVVFSA